MNEIPCPDGYLLNAGSPLAGGHHALNSYLVTVEERGWKPALKQLNSIRDKSQKVQIWMALLERLAWLREHGSPEPYFKQLHDVTYSIEEWKLAPSAAELILVLRKTLELAGSVMPYTPMPHLLAYIEEKGVTPELSAAVREFDEKVRKADFYVNQVRLQMFLSRLDMLAWWDEWNGIDLKRCWSEQVRADYRSMRGVEREGWRKLLHSIHGDEGVRPSGAWLTKAKTIIGEIGPEAMAVVLLRWFTPLRKGGAVRLSRPGSYVLRSLLWLVPLLENKDMAASAAEIAEAVFKPKKNGEKVIRTAAGIAGKEYEPPARPPVPGLDAITARALAAVLSPAAWGNHAPEFTGRVRVDGEVIRVEGHLSSYRVHISTGAVFRESDGQRIEVRGESIFAAAPEILKFGGIAEMLNQVVLLAEDWKHQGGITVLPE
jgi:hypothetical protein